MRKYNPSLVSDNYREIEIELLQDLIGGMNPPWETPETLELTGITFQLTDPSNNKNNRSNYEYAAEFFKWIISGKTDLSEKIKEMNPMAVKFVDTTGLPESFSSSYGWKIEGQLPAIYKELRRDKWSRQAYINILLPVDQILVGKTTTHEYPCTLGIQYLIRDGELHTIVNMRSNNAFSVLPYDVYNFTRLQILVSDVLGVKVGRYYHTVNSLHIYKRDLGRINEYLAIECLPLSKKP